MLKQLIACAFAASAVIACFPQGACLSDPPFVDYCGTDNATEPCQGHMLDANHWESGPISAKWLNFSRERTFLMHFHDAQTGQDLAGTFGSATCDISITSTLAENPRQFVPGAGNNCELDPIFDESGAATGIFVKNDTCADYFVRVTVTVFPSAASDAGTDVTTSDASTE